VNVAHNEIATDLDDLDRSIAEVLVEQAALMLAVGNAKSKLEGAEDEEKSQRLSQALDEWASVVVASSEWVPAYVELEHALMVENAIDGDEGVGDHE
jgi:hypothetical protein